MVIHLPTTMLPSDMRDYRAPRFRMDLVWMALAACLALAAYLEVLPPNAARDAVSPLGHASPTAAHVAAFDCLRLKDRQWLRGGIFHEGDMMNASGCWYGPLGYTDVQ